MLTTSYTYYVPERYLDLFIPPHKISCKTGIILIFTNKHKVTGTQNLNQGLTIKSTHLLYKHLSVSYMPGTVLRTSYRAVRDLTMVYPPEHSAEWQVLQTGNRRCAVTYSD